MVVVIDPQIAGISGDMLLCSLIDLGADKNKIIDGINRSEKFLSNSIIKKIDFERVQKHGIQSFQLILEVDEDVHERKGSEIKKAVINSVFTLGLSQKAKTFAKSCIDTLISSESTIHGVPEESVHFHESSSIDTLVDIVGITIALEDLKLFDEKFFCLPVSVGRRLADAPRRRRYFESETRRYSSRPGPVWSPGPARWHSLRCRLPPAGGRGQATGRWPGCSSTGR